MQFHFLQVPLWSSHSKFLLFSDLLIPHPEILSPQISTEVYSSHHSGLILFLKLFYCGVHPNQRPGHPHLKPWVGVYPDQRPGWLQVITPEAPGTEHLPPSPCAQSPSEPTRSLAERQNAQQRGAAGLGETVVTPKT